MRKAFDANVPKLKPRLKAAAGAAALPVDAGDAAEAPAAPEAVRAPVATATELLGAAAGPAPSPQPSPPLRGGEGDDLAPPTAPAAAAPRVDVVRRSGLDPLAERVLERVHHAAPAPEPENDVLSRKERLDKIKRKVAEASRPQARPHAIPADPARAAESVLALVRDLEAELVRAREREEALRGDLDEVRRELSRAAADGRGAAERLVSCEKDLEEKRAVLSELLAEMQALEEERDESVRRAQALAALDEERARLLEDVGARADEEARLRAEREAEVERLSEELRLSGVDGARLRAAVGELARERDQLAGDLDRARRERDELAEAKHALEQVHAALAQARARLG